MYESQIVEAEDFGFNHYIHHFDELDGDYITFNDEFGCIDVAAECVEEIYWS